MSASALEPSAAAAQRDSRYPWGRGVRAAVSLLLLFHLTALLIGPCSVTPSSVLADRAWRTFRPYLEAAYLNHGYRFFAPEPGPSHLVRYELELADGSRREGVFPNLSEHWPRLLYHRHFMMAEFVNTLADPAAPAGLLDAYSRSYGEHLLASTGAKRATLYLRRHLIPAPEDVATGTKLTDPKLYMERKLGEYRGARP